MIRAVGFVSGWDQSPSRAEKMWVTLGRRSKGVSAFHRPLGHLRIPASGRSHRGGGHGCYEPFGVMRMRYGGFDSLAL